MTHEDMVFMIQIHRIMLGTELLTCATAFFVLVRTLVNGGRLKRIEKNGNGKK